MKIDPNVTRTEDTPMFCSRMPRCAPLVALGLAMLSGFGMAAHADPLPTLGHRLVGHLEGGAAFMLPAYQRDTLGFDGVNYWAAGRFGFALTPAVSLQLSVANWVFTRDAGNGGVVLGSLGARFEPRTGTAGRAFVDANVGLGITQDRNRLGLDVGVGYEFAVTPGLGIGPIVRYGRLFARETRVQVGNELLDEAQFDAQFLSVGVSFSLRRGPPRAVAPEPDAPHDRDGDGVNDGDDLCVDVPQGPRPDPNRTGCPMGDRDRDGVNDPDDLCVDQPAGPTPDPARRGCPLAAVDTDRDGVADPLDQCPTDPQGENPDPQRAGCPDGDDDNDRIRNGLDQCPQAHSGFHPDPARPGCPLPDDDSDAVPNTLDRCLREAGAPSMNPARNGCPGLVRIVGDQIQILSPVFFATSRDRVLPRSTAVLEAVADAMQATPLIARLSVDGHTDDRDDDARNLDLSQRRANSVVRWLVTRGLNTDRFEAHGYGETRPVQPITATLSRSALRDARAANRRVEFRIVAIGTADGNTRVVNQSPSAVAAPAQSPAEHGSHRRHRRARHR